MRVLLIDGTTLRNGEPVSLPRGAWVPEWTGLDRDDPGGVASYASDARSGAQRLVRRPSGLYVAPRLAMGDVAELANPLRELADSGLLFEDDKTQVLTGTNWDLTTWLAGSCNVAAGSRGPTGDSSGIGQAYLLTPTLANGNRQLSKGIGTNLDADTYVFPIWARKAVAGAAGAFSLRLAGGASEVFEHVDLTDRWQRVLVTSPDVAAATAVLNIYPGGNTAHPSGADTQTALVWAPCLFNNGGAPGETDMGGGSVVAVGDTRVHSRLLGDFAWPPPPWTFFCRFTPFWGATDGLPHGIFQSVRGSKDLPAPVLTKLAANTLRMRVTDRAEADHDAAITPTLDQREEWRVIGKLGTDGRLTGWLNEVEFPSKGSAVYVDQTGQRLELGGSSADSADAAIHRLEVWDEDIPAEEFFGVKGLERAA